MPSPPVDLGRQHSDPRDGHAALAGSVVARGNDCARGLEQLTTVLTDGAEEVVAEKSGVLFLAFSQLGTRDATINNAPVAETF
mmetsp:Transcript_25054/g.69827  ORF Transcript_25054/g.69827 Transcript_25054/m.69827 type:complete len:83 (-) Transcript_25054:81-329(-)